MPGVALLVLVLVAALQVLLVVRVADKLTERATAPKANGTNDLQAAGRFAQSA